MKRPLTGSLTALATPFRNGALDEEALQAHVRDQLAHGTSGLVPMGTTGEAATMTPAERARVIAGRREGVRRRFARPDW